MDVTNYLGVFKVVVPQLLDYREINMQLYFPKPLFRSCIFLLRFGFEVTNLHSVVKPINHTSRASLTVKQRVCKRLRHPGAGHSFMVSTKLVMFGFYSSNIF